MAEWLRRWTANPLCSAREGSNPFGVVFFELFFTPISRVVERDTLKRIQNQNAQNNTAFILRRKSSTITRQRRCIENSDSKLAQDNVSSQVQINEGKATLDKSIIQAEKSDCEATTRDVRRRSYNPLSRRSGLSQLHMNEEETDLLYALSSSEIENGHGLPRNNSKHSSSNNPYHRGSLTNSNGSFSFKKSEIQCVQMFTSSNLNLIIFRCFHSIISEHFLVKKSRVDDHELMKFSF